jgi:hypothetical protein
MRSKHQSGPHGGFYRNMRRALDYAIERDYDRCIFFEDDEQFLFPLDFDQVESILKQPDAIQANPMYLRRAFPYRGTLQRIPNLPAYRTNRGFNTTGIWNLDFVRQAGFQFIDTYPSGLPANSRWWLLRGFRLYQMANPVAAVVPPGRKRLNVVYPGPSLYQEHITGTSLVWHQPWNRNRLYELCYQTLQGDSVLTDQSVLPLQSHLDWRPAEPLQGWRSRLPRWLVNVRHFNLKHYRAYRRLEARLQQEFAEMA